MKPPPRGQGLSTHHKGASSPRGSLGRICWASLGPFLAAALVGSVLFRATGRGSGAEEFVVQRNPRNVLKETRFPTGCIGPNCVHGGQAATVAGGGPGADDTATSPATPLVATGGSSSSSSKVVSGGGSPGELPQLFLFIGILSGRGYRHRRLAVREAWSNKAQVPGQVVACFILSDDERTPQVEKELDAYGDIVFVQQKTNYKSILYKTYYVMEYAVTHYDAAFVLKTDDDAFINVAPLMEQLRGMCENPGCQHERVYIGNMAKHSEVLLQPGHKWNNAAFYNHTGLKEYPNYMMGGGYVVGGEVAHVLVDINTRIHLKFTPIEDATLGFWLMAMDLRHIDHPRFYTWAAPCCFKASVRKPGELFVARFQLAEEFEADLCSSDPWIILHKIDSPTKMRYVGARVANCSEPQQPWALAPSIAEYVNDERRAFYMQQWRTAHPGQLLVLTDMPAAVANNGSSSGSGSASLASGGSAAGGSILGSAGAATGLESTGVTAAGLGSGAASAAGSQDTGGLAGGLGSAGATGAVTGVASTDAAA